MTERRAVLRYYDADGDLLNQAPGKVPGEVTEESIIQSSNLLLSKSLYE